MKFKRPEEESFAFELTPLIDVVFLLLIFFMVSTAFIEFTKKLTIELPESKAATLEQKVKSYLVEIDAEGNIYLNGIKLTLTELEQKLRETEGESTRRTVLIKADKRVDYGRAVAVMGLSKAAGISEIGIAVK
jgi:biopolymer transport protein ExbD